MNDQETFNKQVENFHRQIIELVKKYQFRDRDQILCYGISVSQCYILETLHTCGALTVNELARKMYLSTSTITRVVDQLVKKGYVSRREDKEDRRIRLIKLTAAGEALYQESWQNIFQSEKTILENFPPENRDMLIDFLRKLNQAVENWQTYCRPE
jgi:DNA-binding MarR family transcriptional regulator